MMSKPAWWCLVLPILAYGEFGAKVAGQEKLTTPDAATVSKFVEQLNSSDFKMRELAAKELSKLEEVPHALRKLARNGDIEAKRRAEAVVEVIEARFYEKVLQGAAIDVKKVEIDRFVRRMVCDESFVGPKPWEIVQTLAKSVTNKANALGDRKYDVPDFEMSKIPLYKKRGGKEKISFVNQRILVNDPAMRLDVVRRSVVLCTGKMRRQNVLDHSVLIVDGDFMGSAVVKNSVVIVRGKIGKSSQITDRAFPG